MSLRVINTDLQNAEVYLKITCSLTCQFAFWKVDIYKSLKAFVVVFFKLNKSVIVCCFCVGITWQSLIADTVRVSWSVFAHIKVGVVSFGGGRYFRGGSLLAFSWKLMLLSGGRYFGILQYRYNSIDQDIKIQACFGLVYIARWFNGASFISPTKDYGEYN